MPTTPSMPTAATAINAQVTIRGKTSECADSNAAYKLKKRLRPLAQRLMCEARAAESLETKSGAVWLLAAGDWLVFVNVVMVCAP